MNKTSITELISSTPHPQRTVQHLTEFYENDTISPINELAVPKDSNLNHAQPKYNPVRHATDIDTHLLKKRRNASRKKEITSNAVFNEIGTSQEINQNNKLSQSRNMYNMYPQPILLDSDEDNDLSKAPTNHLETLVKEGITVNKPSASITRLQVKVSKQEGNTDLNPEKNRISKTSKCYISKEFRPSAQPSLSSRTAIKPAKKKILLEKHINIPSSKVDLKMGFTEKVLIPEEQSPSAAILNSGKDTENVLKNNGCVSHKRKNNKTLVEDRDEKHLIKWTPRRFENIEVKDTMFKYKVNNKSDDHENANIVKVRNIVFCYENLCTIKGKEISCSTKSCDSEIEKATIKNNNFSSEHLSRFESVMFKHNKQSGGIVAKCLQTDKLNFGYVEVIENQTFTGQHSNITFVLLEGEVTAAINDSTQTLNAGDMLHIDAETEYQFNNHGCSHARLLYVKENIS